MKKKSKSTAVAVAPRQTRAEKSAERRRMAEEIRQRMVDPRGTARPVQTRPITADDLEEIIAAVSQGDTVTGMCRQLGLATIQFDRALDKDQAEGGDARTRYEGAKIRRTDAWAEGIVDIAEAPIDPVVIALGGGQTDLQQRALVIGTKRWLMGKFNMKFGDKQTTVHEGNPNAPIVTKDVSDMTIQEMVGELQRRHREPR